MLKVRIRCAATLSTLVLVPLISLAADDKPPSVQSPDARRTAVGDDKSINIVDGGTGKLLIKIQAHTAKVTTIAFSPDGKLLASGSDDKTVRIFDATVGVALVVLKGHDAGIVAVGFSPDGKTLSSVDKNQKSIKWDPATGKQLP